jgi:hypothetical protein
MPLWLLSLARIIMQRIDFSATVVAAFGFFSFAVCPRTLRIVSGCEPESG